MLKKGNDCTCKTDDGKKYFPINLGWRVGTTAFKYKVSPLETIKAKVQSYRL